MSTDPTPPAAPDLTKGVDAGQIAEGAMLLGHVGEDAVLLARSAGEIFAIGATCTHYGGPLAEGLVVGDTVRCPWHHACFSLRTGEAIRAPALNPLPCWAVETIDGKHFVRARREAPSRSASPASADTPASIVIVGGGGAAQAALETLRREGYAGRITVLSADSTAPCDRPNLSKDYLAGTASEDWIPLREPDFYRQNDIDLRLGTRATAIDTLAATVRTADGGSFPYGALLIATGAEPVRLDIPGADLPHVHYLRSLDDSRSIIRAAGQARRAVVIGASFIGLEVAASLRARNLHVDVVAPGRIPMERILGAEIGTLIRTIHEAQSVQFHLPGKPRSISERQVLLESGEALEADLVVVGTGVRPSLGLAEQAGLALDRGITVDQYLRTSVPGIFAAGDIARWPDPHTGEKIRVEHWVVAERQGQTAARNMLGRNEPFDAVPFFWSVHYDVQVQYVGHAEQWDSLDIDGSVNTRNCRVAYRGAGRTLAVATIGRDLECLRAELALESIRTE
jgi:NADPH-dependent 2,4-dienoyl-CoA reductase/sulfur reductase-like enzyme/nitrite reductase/ring-hydroxylating ferredoxin subunit